MSLEVDQVGFEFLATDSCTLKSWRQLTEIMPWYQFKL